ncbi:hypothetical protein P3H80_14180 [Mycolicibacterium septicum]|uniref:hypothetical protein n=1 Tax=Mycolicibacterium septicum TaxID=98668 RepID=UPI0023E16D86|nr:hypothetical protein [Mycolicibacterium septicum]MDF3338581.1 hypothetical protein [Mycolicibacterium septicum]
MSEARLYIPALAMPLNMLLLLWMVIGRGLFAQLGWMVVFGVLASPVLALCLVMTSRMMRKPPGRELTSGQAWAQIVLWSAMFVFGLACVDGGDSGTFPSILMRLVGEGPAMETVSNLLWAASVLTGVAAWFVLLTKLTRGVAVAPPAQQSYPYPGYPPAQTGPGPSA